MNEIDLFLPSLADEEDKSSPLKNRIRKNYRHLRKWAKRSITNCFRIYDRDIKEYPLTIDFYAGQFSVHYFSFDRETDDPPSTLQAETEEALCSLFNIASKNIHWRTRKRRRKKEQYEKIDQQQEFFTVIEYGVRFKVNLRDYLDTGLFLDHRETRHLVASMAQGKRILNLFAYTCSFSVHASIAGAAYTKSVDMSNTYTEWGRDNFILNGQSTKNNDIVRADCLKFMDHEIRTRSKYDIIIIDPPTISRSKKMENMFDIQVDYIPMLTNALKLLANNGTILFSTNSRRFAFDNALFSSQCIIKDITKKTIPIDFRNQRIHRCWIIMPIQPEKNLKKTNY